MSFRKRDPVASSKSKHPKNSSAIFPGLRPSPLDGRPVLSTGTRSLDSLLAGHTGLALGTSLLVEELGTTDYAGVLLQYYAAEGIAQDHQIHVLGYPETWARELPGFAVSSGKDSMNSQAKERMKISWRYEKLRESGTAYGLLGRSNMDGNSNQSLQAFGSVFCHDFDLSTRLTLPSPSPVHCVPLDSLASSGPLGEPVSSPFTSFLKHISEHLSSTSPTTVHRVIVPNLFSPAIYPPAAIRPEHTLHFLHSLRAMLRTYSSRLTCMLTLPLFLHPRSTGLTRWIELLCDGVIELAPLPSVALTSPTGAASGSSAGQDETSQGMLMVHRLPILQEKGGGGPSSSCIEGDMSFHLSRRRGLVIKPYSLPPMVGNDGESRSGTSSEHGVKASLADIEF